jgi:carbamoylphosphate synthase large subunit
MRILLTCAAGKLISKTIKYLREDKNLNNLFIVGVDQKKIKTKKYFDKSYKIKFNKDYLKNIIKISKINKINLIIPYSDKESIFLSKKKIFFKKKKISILTNSYKVNKKISNKYTVYNILSKKGIKVPKYFIFKNIVQFKKYIKILGYPEKNLVIKPVDGIGGRGVIFLKGNKDKLEKWEGKGKREKIVRINRLNIKSIIKKYKKLIVMEKLNSPAYDVDYFKYNKKSILSIRQRLNPSGIPYKGNKIIRSTKIKNYCNRIADVMKINSLVDLDLLHNKKKEPILLEINPRPSGSVVVNSIAKFPLLSYVISTILKKKYKIKKLLSTKTIHI